MKYGFVLAATLASLGLSTHLVARADPKAGDESVETPLLLEDVVPDAPAARAAAREKILAAKKLIVDAFPQDRAAAENLLIEASRLAPHDADAYAELARYTLWQIASGLRDPSELHRSSQLALHVKEIAPDRPLGDYVTCEIFLALGQFQQALNVYVQAFTKFPNHTDTKAFEARYWSDSNPVRALEAAQLALASGHPMDDLSPAIALAIKTSSPAGNVGAALAKFAEIYPDRWLWHRAGLAYSEEGQPQKAQAAFLKAIALGNTLESQLQLGILYYVALQEPKRALVHLQKLVAHLDARVEPANEAMALALGHLSLAYLGSGQKDEALKASKQAFRLAAAEDKIVVGFFEEYKARNQAQTFRSALEEVSKVNPALDYAHITLGNLASERNDFDSAAAHFADALALSPERDDLLAARAHAEYKRKRLDTALHYFDEAAKVRPGHASHHYNKACMLALLGRKDEALTNLKVALEMNQDLRDSARQDTDLAALRADQGLAGQLRKLGVLADTGTQESKTSVAEESAEEPMTAGLNETQETVSPKKNDAK